jgi:Holliday junction resolvasome, endonuclease subunit
MITLGIDPGTLFTGFGLVEKDGKEIRAVDYGVISTTAKDEMPKRLKQIYDALASKIEQHRPAKSRLKRRSLVRMCSRVEVGASARV